MYIWHTQCIYFIIYFLLKKLNLNKYYKYQFMIFNVLYYLLLSAIFKKNYKKLYIILIKSDHLNDKTYLDLKIFRYSNSVYYTKCNYLDYYYYFMIFNNILFFKLK